MHRRAILALIPAGLLSALPSGAARAETTVIVDPTIQYQTFEGWGTSLAWWAKVVGDFPEPARSDYMDKAFDPVKGLGLNVVRYNIGGGENPEHLLPNKQFLPFRAAVPGFEPAPGKWDWSADAAQRWVLKDAIRRGANQLEAFSNSPPYWMTISGTVTGNQGGADNLKPADDGIFAHYLATVAKHYRDDWGITFRDIEPLNEPDGRWWKYGNGQEGCFVERPHQNLVVRATGAAIDQLGLPMTVAASDANTIGDADRTSAFYDATALRHLSKINTHSYGGGDRTQLSNFAITHGKDLWLSEYGDGDASGMQMSRVILEDMNGLHPSAWVYWQVVDSAGGWGFLKSPQTNETDTAYTINKKFYVMANYSRFVRPGCRLIAVRDPNSLAALDAKAHRLVIVKTNSSDQPEDFRFDLSRFTRVGPEMTAYRTSPTEDLAPLPPKPVAGKNFAAVVPPHSVTTFIFRAVFDGEPGIDYRASFGLVNAGNGLGAAAQGDNPTLAPVGTAAAQRWGLIGVGGGAYKIVNRANGHVVDVSESSKTSGAALLLYGDNGGDNQLWRLERVRAGVVRFVNVNSGLALAATRDTAGAASKLVQAAGVGPLMEWRLTPAR